MPTLKEIARARSLAQELPEPERTCRLAELDAVEHVPPVSSEPSRARRIVNEVCPPRPSLKDIVTAARRHAERQALEYVLLETQWNRRTAARRLEISYRSLLYKIDALGLSATRAAKTHEEFLDRAPGQ